MMQTRWTLRRRKIGKALRHPIRMWPEIREFARGLGSSTVHRARVFDPSDTADLPDLLYYFINSECNLRCKMCDIGLKDDTFFTRNINRARSDYLTLEEIRAFLKTLHWRPTICINGSEPLLRPDAVDIVKAIVDAGCRAEIITNGMLLEKKAEDLVATGIHHITVSLDGTREIHDAIRNVPGSYDKAVRGIQAVNAARGGGFHPELSINCVISPANQDRMVEIAEELVQLDVAAIFFLQFNFTTAEMARRHNAAFPEWPTTVTRVQHYDPDAMDIPLIHRQIREIEARYPGHNLYFRPYLDEAALTDYYHDPFRILEGQSICRQPWLFGQLLPNGDLNVNSECFATKPFGNIRNEPLERIWNNDAYRAFRKLLRENGGSLPGCARCHALYCANDKHIAPKSLLVMDRSG